MPHCYFVNDYRQSELAVIESPPPSNRSQHGLPQGGDALREVRNGSRSVNSSSSGSGSRERRGGKVAGGKTEEEKGKGVVLCNFNRLHKIDPITFGAWMKVNRVQFYFLPMLFYDLTGRIGSLFRDKGRKRSYFSFHLFHDRKLLCIGARKGS